MGCLSVTSEIAVGLGMLPRLRRETATAPAAVYDLTRQPAAAAMRAHKIGLASVFTTLENARQNDSPPQRRGIHAVVLEHRLLLGVFERVLEDVDLCGNQNFTARSCRIVASSSARWSQHGRVIAEK